MKLVQRLRGEYPALPVIARVHEVTQIEDMLHLGATAVFSDSLGISLSMRHELMRALRLPEALVREAFRM